MSNLDKVIGAVAFGFTMFYLGALTQAISEAKKKDEQMYTEFKDKWEKYLKTDSKEEA